MGVTKIELKDIITTEKHVYSFEVPSEVLKIMTIDEINKSVDWYLKWKMVTPIQDQNTCVIKDTFSNNDAIKVILGINIWKYLRGKNFDSKLLNKYVIK